MKKIVEYMTNNLTGLRGHLLSYAQDEIATHFDEYEESIVENLEEDYPELTTMSTADLERLNETTALHINEHVLGLESVYKQLLALRDALKSNEDVDWSVADANWVYETLNQILDVSDDCENFTSVGDCDSIEDHGAKWHNETLQQLGDKYEVSYEYWSIQDNGVAIDCYPTEMNPEEDGDLTYMWLWGAGWTENGVCSVIESELFSDHPVYLLDDRGLVLCGEFVYPVLPTGRLDFSQRILRLSDCVFVNADCVATVHCLCEGGE